MSYVSLGLNIDDPETAVIEFSELESGAHITLDLTTDDEALEIATALLLWIAKRHDLFSDYVDDD